MMLDKDYVSLYLTYKYYNLEKEERREKHILTIIISL